MPFSHSSRDSRLTVRPMSCPQCALNGCNSLIRTAVLAASNRDNSVMESFFSSMKAEHTAKRVYRSRGQARADVFDYI